MNELGAPFVKKVELNAKSGDNCTPPCHSSNCAKTYRCELLKHGNRVCLEADQVATVEWRSEERVVAETDRGVLLKGSTDPLSGRKRGKDA
jgi:hypothetical protein